MIRLSPLLPLDTPFALPGGGNIDLMLLAIKSFYMVLLSTKTNL